MLSNRPWLILIPCSLIMVLLLFAPALSGSFRFDDFANIVNNPAFAHLDWELKRIWIATWSSDAGMLKRPVSMASFALNVASSGMAPSYFIATNIAIHMFCGLALGWLLHLITSFLYPEYSARNRLVSLFAAFAWAIHPLNALPVVYIVQRMTLLCALFSFLAMASYAKGRLQQLHNQRGRRYFLLGLLFMVLAIFSKENGALVPAFWVLMECILFRGKAAAPVLGKNIQKTANSLLILGFFSAAVFLILAHDWYSHGYINRSFTLEQRLLTEPRVLFIYLLDLLTPRLSGLNLYQDDIALSINWVTPWTTPPAIVGLSAMVLGALCCVRRHPLLSFALSIFLVGHSLESSVIPLEIAHLHRNYLPDFAWFLLVAHMIATSMASPRYAGLTKVVSSLWLLGLGLVTYQLTSLWGNPVDARLFSAKTTQGSARVHADAGQFFYFLTVTAKSNDEKERYYRLARSEYMRTLDSSPPSIVGPLIILNMDSMLGHPLDQPLYEQVRTALMTGPQSLDILTALVSLTTGIHEGVLKNDVDALISLVITAISNPDIAADNRGRLMNELVILYSAQGDYISAELLAKDAVKLAPNLTELHLNLLKLYRRLNRPESEWRPELNRVRGLPMTVEQETALHQLETLLDGSNNG